MEVERTPQHDDGIRHYFRKNEFPLALCGHISPERTIYEACAEPEYPRLSCPTCTKILYVAGLLDAQRRSSQ